MKRLDLNGSWELRECGSYDKVPVAVPGSVLAGLMDAGKIPDPFDRENEYAARDLFRKDYEFSKTFSVTEELLSQDAVTLVCEGLDTLTDIYLNGSLAASTDNMHRTWRIAVKELLQVGKNHIRIVFKSVLQYMENYKSEENKEIHYVPCSCMKGNQYLRKAHSMFGWDWGPQLVDAGIFRDIYLEGVTGGRLFDVHIRQNHTDGNVDLSVAVQIEKIQDARIGKWSVTAEVWEKTGELKDSQAIGLGEMDKLGRITAKLHIEQAKLWWPNGYGEQPLYGVCVRLLNEDGETADTVTKTIGLRTLTVSCDKDEWGSEFAFLVNGLKIFARGGNYIPEDCVYSRITKERQEYILGSCVRANYNCVRVWGGGYYPSEAFYDLCDRYGLIVWQDLMFACNVYDVTEEFAKNCRMEILDNVKRLRHHASLGLWCGNNEIESGWHHWEQFQEESMYLRADYIKLFEYILPKAVRETDPDTFYWPSSPSSGGCFDYPDDENRGDAHYWDVWHGQKPFTDYQKYYFRFCSEFGFQSFPCKKTVDSFTQEEDRNIFSKVMESHQKNEAANGKILYYLSENFRYPKDFESLLYISQVLQGVAIKYGSEHFRRNRGRCMGTLYWQVNDNWPVASWASMDYFGRWKALHYMAAKFYAPLAASIRKNDDGMALFLANETGKAQTYKAVFRVRDLYLNIVREVKTEGSVEAYSVKKLLEERIGVLMGGAKADEVFAEATVILEDGTVLTQSETFVPYKYMELPEATLAVDAREIGDAYEISITGEVFAPFVELDFADADVIFSDNFFTLTDTAPMKITIAKEDIYRGSFSGAEDLKKRLQIRTLRDSY